MGKENLISKFIARFNKSHIKPIDNQPLLINAPEIPQLPSKSEQAFKTALETYYFSRGEQVYPDANFIRNMRVMAEAIEEDETFIWATEDLGISQALRLSKFLKKLAPGEQSDNTIIPAMADHWEELRQQKRFFADFPTVGGEFHILPNSNKLPHFWERVAILNMSQKAQQDPKVLSVPFSKEAKGIIEVRMNPSIYPVTVANWHLIRRILPEINNSYFTITLGRESSNLTLSKDSNLVKALQTLGNLAFASFFQKETLDEQLDGELAFGDFYLGVTIRVKNGVWSTTGNAKNMEGQLNLYCGLGDLFPELAYYLSMAFVEPRIIEPMGKYVGLSIKNAYGVAEEETWLIFQMINKLIQDSTRLKLLTDSGQRIIDKLTR